VEACHRDPAIWGRDALAFKPERFDSMTPLQKEAYIRFGTGPHRCPAVAGFGERLLLMLVVALGVRLGPDKAEISFHDELLDSDEKAPLATGRADMEEWEMEFLRD
jgi:hypothetical protein